MDEENWGIRTNNQIIKDILNDEDIVKFIKSRGLHWFRHVQRVKDARMPKKFLKGDHDWVIQEQVQKEIAWANQTSCRFHRIEAQDRDELNCRTRLEFKSRNKRNAKLELKARATLDQTGTKGPEKRMIPEG
ncbi:hypothetical protein HHI36_020737 [Cryptolaemus montrouzieri]|uniref:Uncharacterized protein n=1 Tax=Cryptolaemus montrouzieri TaxID=559131 RepID=A0ABD2NB73_9CUCU